MTTKSVEPNVSALRAIHTHLVSRIPEQYATARQVAGEVGRLADLAGALAQLHSTADPQITAAAHFARVSRAADRFNKETTAAINRILKIQGDGLADIERRRNQKIHLVPDREYAAELRAAFRALGESEKTAMLNDFVERGDGPALAAIIKVPTYLTGLVEQQRQLYEAAYVGKHAPELVDEEKALNEAAEAAFTTTRTAGTIAKTFSDPVRLAEITKAEEAAAKAAAAFDRTAASA
jgi:hypothetical protein